MNKLTREYILLIKALRYANSLDIKTNMEKIMGPFVLSFSHDILCLYYFISVLIPVCTLLFQKDVICATRVA